MKRKYRVLMTVQEHMHEASPADGENHIAVSEPWLRQNC